MQTIKKNKIKKILITVVAGYIGSKLATQLLELGHKVIGVDIFDYDSNSISHLYIKDNFNFIKADVTKKKIVKQLIKNVDFIIPLAALVGAPLCMKQKKRAMDTNFKAIELIVKNLKANQKIIYPTTNSGYGIGQQSKYCDEKTPLNPISIYGKTKAMAETVVLKHKNSVCFRLATVFGCSFRMRSDLLVNFFVKTAMYKKKLNLFEPQFRRNFIHINDVVLAFVFAINNFDKIKSNIYNLGFSSANLTKIE